MNRTLRILLLAFLMFGLTSCSKIGWAIRFADVYIMNELDNYLDLTRAQSREIEPRVEKIIADVRQQDFPRIAQAMENVEASLASGTDPTESQLTTWATELQKISLSVIRRAEPIAMYLAENVSAEQEKNFAEEFESRTKKMRQDVSTESKARRKDLERTRRLVEYFVPDLSRSQSAKIEDFVRANPSNFESQIRNREHLMASLSAARGEERKIWIRKLLEDPNLLRTPEAIAVSRERQDQLSRFLAELWKDLSPAQKENALRSLKEKAAEFRRLSQI